MTTITIPDEALVEAYRTVEPNYDRADESDTYEDDDGAKQFVRMAIRKYTDGIITAALDSGLEDAIRKDEREKMMEIHAALDAGYEYEIRKDERARVSNVLMHTGLTIYVFMDKNGDPLWQLWDPEKSKWVYSHYTLGDLLAVIESEGAR